MEFEGRIQKVLPVRSGTSSKGEWKALPFVFEYFESADQRWSDKVLLETMEPAIMGKIGSYVERGVDGKGIVENGCMKLKSEIKCRCGFSHSVKEWQGKMFNHVRLYKFELIQGAATMPQVQGAFGQQPTQQQIVYPQQAQQEENDDLPF